MSKRKPLNITEKISIWYTYKLRHNRKLEAIETSMYIDTVTNMSHEAKLLWYRISPASAFIDRFIASS